MRREREREHRSTLASFVRSLRGDVDRHIAAALVGDTPDDQRRRLEDASTKLLFRALVERLLRDTGHPSLARDAAFVAAHAWLFEPPPPQLSPAWCALLTELPPLEPLTDPVQLGWAYQFWRDPIRAEIDARIGARGKVSAVELAEKTQLFTEQYMVDWLLQNSLAPILRAIARRSLESAGGGRSRLREIVDGWPFVLGDDTLDAADAPPSLRELRLLDPACGAGHFLLGVFDVLAPLYEAEAEDHGERVDRTAIAETILRENVWGGDIDNRAVAVARLSLSLKAWLFARPTEGSPSPSRPLFAPRGLVGLSPVATDTSMLSDEARKQLDEWRIAGALIEPERWPASVRAELAALPDDPDEMRASATRSPAATLVDRTAELLSPARYDVVCGNPPYLATAKMDLPDRTIARLFGDMPDLAAAFFVRGLALCKPHGRLAYVTPSNWMTLSSFQPLRDKLREAEITALADLGKGAFRYASKLIQTAMVVVAPTKTTRHRARAVRVGSTDGAGEVSMELFAAQLKDKSAFFFFDPDAGRAVSGEPMLVGPSWTAEALRSYRLSPKVGDVAEGAAGLATSDNHRFLRAIWELTPKQVAEALQPGDRSASGSGSRRFLPYVKGADGAQFFEPLRWVLVADDDAKELSLANPRVKLDTRGSARGCGVAYTTIGHRFAARLHTVPSIRDVAGASFFPTAKATPAELLCALNRTVVKELAHTLNPTINFQIGDVRRLPFEPPRESEAIVRALRVSFDRFCETRETSHTFRRPGAQRFAATSRWAQAQIDAPEGAALTPAPGPEADEEPSSDERLSHLIGVALGRFASTDDHPGPLRPLGGASLEPTLHGPSAHSSTILPFLFVGPDEASLDDLRRAGAPNATTPLSPFLAAFPALAAQDPTLTTPRRWLIERLFAHHEALHLGRPVYFPLSSAKRRFVVFVWFHHLTSDTLPAIVRDALAPCLDELERRPASAKRDKLVAELCAFVAMCERVHLRGAPAYRPRARLSPDGPAQEGASEAGFRPFHSDGTRIVAAAMWPLLHPMWQAPAATWAALCAPVGKRHLDWSKTAARAFPERVRARAARDASLAYAHRIDSAAAPTDHTHGTPPRRRRRSK